MCGSGPRPAVCDARTGRHLLPARRGRHGDGAVALVIGDVEQVALSLALVIGGGHLRRWAGTGCDRRGGGYASAG